MDFSVYILYSRSLDKFYIGYTANFTARLAYHNSTQNKIWTKRGQPWEVHLLIDRLEKSQALKMEKHLKKMKSRNYLINLKADPSAIDALIQRFRKSI
ncbi:GIY-YIG nuclease family protein [Algoriphagus halophytocola]|uniref:GIY-YIG nuclease family protein n=1 Tax=Algoriphagus halophytocola TaxID=2991499 RepID=A0ABY6MPR3_9BACT|nr:GIY-YIG nuclease family protein [Algoriphagus sp. TR-M5]UZD24339.1 GIY-YIG nuclease family protein [Algoriphagus sp. TR-M5]UZD24340.1 GIY-YIG nuclease family protein [Algoriphagus sp. TR-M5]UZD24342.1 GIY-YIG nuclease family protein [Algoriphagus sp. TR-M5]